MRRRACRRGRWRFLEPIKFVSTADGKVLTQTVTVKMDPRVQATPDDLEKLFALESKLAASVTSSAEADLEAHSIREQVDKLSKSYRDRPFLQRLRSNSKSWTSKLVYCSTAPRNPVPQKQRPVSTMWLEKRLHFTARLARQMPRQPARKSRHPRTR